MKHKGSVFEYEEERNKDFMRAYREQISSCSTIVLSDVLRKMVNMPSCRFWVSEERAAIVISRMMRGDTLENMRPNNREMYQEIYSRVLKLKKQYPNLSILDIAFKVVRQPAPKFYLTPASAKIILYRIKKKEAEASRNRLLHIAGILKHV